MHVVIPPWMLTLSDVSFVIIGEKKKKKTLFHVQVENEVGWELIFSLLCEAETRI